MNKKLMGVLFSVMLSGVFLLSGCGPDALQQEEAEGLVVTDLVGREVSLTKLAAEKVVAIGPGALRLYCYVNGIDKVVGVEQIEKDTPTGRPYLLAYPALTDLPVIGPGGPNNAPDPEKILAVKPDVIFSTYNTEKAALDELQTKTGIPVVALSYGKVSTFDPQVNQSLELIGKITGQEEKAEEVIAFIKGCQQDLNERTKDVPDSEKPSVYIGALSSRGTHGIESTQSKYSLFQAINAKNVADGIDKAGSIMIDKEKLIDWDPDIIFIDLSGYPLVQEDYGKNPKFYKTLTAVQKGELYSQMPYNFYTTNIDTAITNAYYLGKVLYPEQFKDIDPAEKADEIYESLLGKKVYAQMEKDFGGFKKLSLP